MRIRFVVPLVVLLGCGSEEPGASAPAAASDAESARSEPSTPQEPGVELGSDLSAVTGAERDAMAAMIARSAGMKKRFEDAYGFAIFPSVGKGGFIVGGGGGSGSVYEKGALIGTAKIKFLSVGAQIGGQSFTEVILFETESALDRFKRGGFEFGAQVTAVAVTEGAAKDAPYQDGVAVFTLPKKGLMAEASVSGQDFEFIPK